VALRWRKRLACAFKEKIVIENTLVTNTKYLNGFQYKNDVLDFFPTAEGYVKSTPVYGGLLFTQ